MKTLLKCFGLCLAVPVIALGNLGDDELKISQSYGSATGEQKLSPSLMMRHYRTNDMAITVTFLNGTSQCEVYKRLDGTPLADDQIQSLLEANANKLSWTPKTSAEKNSREWLIAGPVPAPTPASASGPAVFAVSGKHKTAEGTRMVAVDTLSPKEDTSTPSAPAILRKAVYKSTPTDSVLSVFTAAYDRVARHELPRDNPTPVQE